MMLLEAALCEYEPSWSAADYSSIVIRAQSKQLDDFVQSPFIGIEPDANPQAWHDKSTGVRIPITNEEVTMNSRNFFLMVLGLIAIAGISSILLATRSTTTTNSGATLEVSYSSQGVTSKAILTQVGVDALVGSRYVSGSANAPVTIIEFADYQCPACGVFATTVEGQFKTEFVDSGRVRYAYRDFPLPQHANARLAAQAAACAAREDQFEGMKAVLFRAQADWSSLNSERAAQQFAEYGGIVGATQIATCLQENADFDAINADIEMGRRVGMNATPSFVINGYLVSGSLPIEAFRAIIDKLTKR
jgi:protein-disulfide isomerase